MEESEPDPELESSEPDDPDPEESDPDPEESEPEPEFEPSVPEPEVTESPEPLVEEPEPELEPAPVVAAGVGSATGELVGATDGASRLPGEAVKSAGEVTSRGASGEAAGTRSVGVDRSRPATT